MKPKALIDAVKAKHPNASKKDIARAAFLTVIMSAEYDPEDTQALIDIVSEAGDSRLSKDAGDDEHQCR